MKKLFALIYLASFVNSSFADDSTQRSFDGFYVGGSVGAVKADSDSKEVWRNIETGFTNENKPKGLMIGGLVGYNYVTDKNVLFGVEANYHFYGADDETFEKENGIKTDKWLVETNLKEKASVKARLGYIFNNDRTLAFLTGGYVTSKTKTKFTSIPSESNGTETQWHEGYLVGAGVEHFVSEKLTAKVEYNYVDYNKEKIQSIYDSKFHNQIDEHSVQIGLIYHFQK